MKFATLNIADGETENHNDLDAAKSWVEGMYEDEDMGDEIIVLVETEDNITEAHFINADGVWEKDEGDSYNVMGKTIDDL